MSKSLKKPEVKALFAERLRKLREGKDLSQKDLAVQMNITSAAISSWEKAKTFPSKDKLKELSRIFGTTVDYLTGKTNKPLCIKGLVPDKDGNLKLDDIKIVGYSPEYKTQIGTIIRELDTTHRKYLYELLLASQHFGDNEWKALILVAKAFSQCRIPTLKAYHPLTDLPTLKSFFNKTIDVIDKFKHDTALKLGFSTSSLENHLIYFEYALQDDFERLPNPFKDTKSIKSTLAKTNTNIESIKNELRKLQIIPPENDKTGKENKSLQENYIQYITNTYEDDIRNMAEFLGRSDKQNELTEPTT